VKPCRTDYLPADSKGDNLSNKSYLRLLDLPLMSRTIIHLKPKKLKQRIQVINDALPGILLLYTGLGALMDQGLKQAVIPFISVTVGIVVVRSAIEELRSSTAQKKINWFGISGGCVILLEAANRYKPYKGFQPAHLLALAGVITILRGIFPEKFPRFRRVELTDEGLFARTKPFLSIKFLWNDLVRIDRSPSMLTFVFEQRTSKLRLKHIENRVEVMDKIIETAREHGIKTTEAA
jgi:hypothetical protein